MWASVKTLQKQLADTASYKKSIASMHNYPWSLGIRSILKHKILKCYLDAHMKMGLCICVA